MPEKIPIDFVIMPHFENKEALIMALEKSSLFIEAPPEIRVQVTRAILNVITAAQRRFPSGVSDCDEDRSGLQEIYEDLPSNVSELALRSFVPNLCLYADANLGRKVLSLAMADLLDTAMDCFTKDVSVGNPHIMRFLKSLRTITQGAQAILYPDERELHGEDNCKCPACALRRAMSRTPGTDGEPVVVHLNPDDPTLPPNAKEYIEQIIADGNIPGIEKTTMKIDYTKPDSWAAAIAKFPPGARASILSELRKQYRKATGKFAPGDPAIGNN